MATIGLAFLAGVLSLLSPCVLPLVPMVLAAATGEHRMGPAALAAGLALSFTAIGIFIALFGFALGLDADVFRVAAAVLMIAIGAVLLVPAMQVRLAAAAGPAANWTEQRFGNFSTSGLSGQFGVGLLLGAGWAPRRFWRRAAKTSGKSRSPCSPLASAPPCPCCFWALRRAKQS